jgi:Fuc2NAc and GlcNAc transferase
VALKLVFGTIAALLLSAFLTGVIRSFAVIRGLLDVPNARSSHVAPTPRGGGLAIAVTVLAAVVVFGFLGLIQVGLVVALLVGGALVAAIGLLDDHRHVSAGARLAVHFLAAGCCALALGFLPPIDFGVATWSPGIAGTAIAIIFVVWFLNLFNFMDGIDGIASVEAISVAAIAAGLIAFSGGDPSIVRLLLVLAAAVAGFLIWNWPPARIFMGDVGSGFLGFALAAIAWSTMAAHELSPWVWLILVGTFFADATVTLVRRWRRGERLHLAHRSHAYQRLTRRFGSHQVVTLGVLVINLIWLAPLALIAVVRPSLGAALTGVAWVPLMVIAWLCGAGSSAD